MARKIRNDSAKSETLRILFYVTACWATDLNTYLLSIFSSASQVSKALKDLCKDGYITVLEKEQGQSKKVVMITEKGKVKYIDDNPDNDYLYIHRNDYGKEYNQRRAKGELDKYFRNMRVVLMMEASGVPVFPDEKPSLTQLYHMLLPHNNPEYISEYYDYDDNGEIIKYPYNNYCNLISENECREMLNKTGIYYTIQEYRYFLKTIDGDRDSILGTVSCGIYLNNDKCLIVYRQANDQRPIFKLSESDRRLTISVENYLGQISNFRRSIMTGGIRRGTVDALVIPNGFITVSSMVMGIKGGKRTSESKEAKKRRELRERRRGSAAELERIDSYQEYTVRIKGLNSQDKIDKLKNVLLTENYIFKVDAEIGIINVVFQTRSGVEINKRHIRQLLKDNGFEFKGFKSEKRSGSYLMNYANSIYSNIFIIPANSTGIAMMSYFLTTSVEQWRSDGVSLANRFSQKIIGQIGFRMNASNEQFNFHVANAIRSVELTDKNGNKVSSSENIKIVWLPVFEVKRLYQMSVDNNNDLYGIICFEGMEETFAHAIRKKIWFFRPETAGNIVIDNHGNPVVNNDGEYSEYNESTLAELDLPYEFNADGYRVDKKVKAKKKREVQAKPRYHNSSVRFELNEYNRLKLMAKQKGTSVGKLIRTVMKKYTDENLEDWKYSKSKEPKIGNI